MTEPMTLNQRDKIIKTWTFEEVRDRAASGLNDENPPSPETVFFMALAEVLATEIGLERLLEDETVNEEDFSYTTLSIASRIHKKQLIEFGRIVTAI